MVFIITDDHVNNVQLIMAAKKIGRKVKEMGKLKVTDVFCHICRGTLIEPVTVPCNHVFCKLCFDYSMEETSYSCPLCRKRISNWVRSARKTNSLLDLQLWEKIQEEYKWEVDQKLAGKDDGLDERIKLEYGSNHIISTSGEIHREFLNLSSLYEGEMRAEREKEERESLALIERLQKEEEEQELKMEEETKELILRLQVTDEADNSDENKMVLMKTPRPRKKPSTTSSASSVKSQLVGPMDRHIKKLSLSPKASPCRILRENRPESSNSCDSFASEMNHFKPICCAPKTPPKRSIDGRYLEVSLRKITPNKNLVHDFHSISLPVESDHFSTSNIHSPFSAFKGRLPEDEGLGSPVKKLKLEPESGVLKEINLDENSDSNPMGFGKLDIDGGKVIIDKEVVEEHILLEKRLLQEKADRELALKLSKEWSTYQLRRSQANATCRRNTRQTALVRNVIGRRKK